MRISWLGFLFGLTTLASAQPRPNTRNTRPAQEGMPLLRISFQAQDPIPGLDSPAVRLPFQCTRDGTVFVSRIRPPDASKALLTSISPSRETYVFPLEHVPDLYDRREVDDSVTDDNVTFLLEAANRNVQGKRTLVSPDGTTHDWSGNTSERHFYLVIFNRKGEYQKTVQMEDGLQLLRLARFPSGLFLAYAYDQASRAPQVMLLKDDGAVLKYLQVKNGDLPSSALKKITSGNGAPALIAPVQLVPQGHVIYVLQNQTDYPILEVTEGGDIRVMRPKLPEDERINMLIPSDVGIYAEVAGTEAGLVYQLDAETGAVVNRYQVRNDAHAANIACVHEGKFISLEPGNGAIVPLIGTAEPVSDLDADR